MRGSYSKSGRSSRRARNRRSNGDFPDNFCNFKTLFPGIHSPEGTKPDVLKDLYGFLDKFSSNAKWSYKFAHEFDLEICHDGIKLTFADINELSNVLFTHLEEKFERLFSNLCADKDLRESSSNSGLFDAVEVVNLLFRCCMLVLTLLEPSQNLILEKLPILLGILRKSSSHHLVDNTGRNTFVFEKSVFRENDCCTSSVEGFTASLQFLEPYDPLLFLMSTILEVFVDELYAHGQSRNYFRMINSAVYINETLFNSQSAHSDIGIEAICNHFIISFSHKQVFEDFLNRLFCTHAIELKYPYRAPALSVTTAVSLLLNPTMVSAPKYVQAHLISLVSEAVNIKNLKPDRKLTNCFLSTFEKSVTLYMRHMSRLQTDGYSGFTSNSSHDIAYPPFELYVTPETKNKVDSLIAKLDNDSNLDLNDSLFRMKSDMVSSCMRYVKECQNAYALSCEDEILSILSCLVLKASESYDDEAVRPIECTTLQNIYLLASVLKLMSISLLQTIRCLRNGDELCRLKTLKDLSSCKEYKFILGAITCFRDLDISLSLQQDLSKVMMSNHPTRHVDSKMMFLHFSGLMSLSFVTGLDCLAKACLLAILALLNLFIFEEGDLDALESSSDTKNESFSFVRFHETKTDRNSSLVVASKFQKIQSLYSSLKNNKYNRRETLSSETLASTLDMEPVAGLEEETEETSNGEVFLKCVLNMGENDDLDDLASFVECKQGKDYSAWFKNRKRYRCRLLEKMAVLRWKRKKKTWKTLKGKRKNC
ncbi:hypothetical protein ABFS83_03G122300 [Erythranthe nasuta]